MWSRPRDRQIEAQGWSRRASSGRSKGGYKREYDVYVHLTTDTDRLVLGERELGFGVDLNALHKTSRQVSSIRLIGGEETGSR